MARVRLPKKERVRLVEPVDYWTLQKTEAVFTSPKGYTLNSACVPIDESKYNFLKNKGVQVLRLIISPNAGHWWMP